MEIHVVFLEILTLVYHEELQMASALISELDAGTERFALERGGRSARLAR